MEYMLFYIVKIILFLWVVRVAIEWLEAKGFIQAKRIEAERRRAANREREVDVRTYDVYPQITGYLPHPRDRADEIREFQAFKRMKQRY